MKWSCLGNRFTCPEAFVSHPNAALTPRARLRLARLIVEQGWPAAQAAKMFMVAEKTARNGPAATVTKAKREWLIAARARTTPRPKSLTR